MRSERRHPIAIVFDVLLAREGYGDIGNGKKGKACENLCCRPYAAPETPEEEPEAGFRMGAQRRRRKTTAAP